ncbi:MAG: lycopene cyclase domain-containing protein, partial [Anaerolineae bacterium]|nr:lycopene cyclase domain-containing protein [Anaerolineae bacterium]
RVWLVSVLLPTLWLTTMDAVAIKAGTWTISEAQTVDFKLAGIVPIEEGIFFLITNLLIVQGMMLFYLPESWERAAQIRQWWENKKLIFG